MKKAKKEKEKAEAETLVVNGMAPPAGLEGVAGLPAVLDLKPMRPKGIPGRKSKPKELALAESLALLSKATSSDPAPRSRKSDSRAQEPLTETINGLSARRSSIKPSSPEVSKKLSHRGLVVEDAKQAEKTVNSRGRPRKKDVAVLVVPLKKGTKRQSPNVIDDDMPIDENEPRYCVCNNVSYGNMVACDNRDVSAPRSSLCHFGSPC